MNAPAPLLVIDLQTGMFASPKFPAIHDADGLTARARKVIGWARETGHPVAFVRHDGEAGDELAPGEAGWPVWPALGQQDDEPTFSKSVGDAFSQPALVQWMETMGAGEVILLGAQTDQCVAATVKGALLRGLKVTVVGDAHSTWDFKGETAGQIIDRHNRLFAEAGATVTDSETLAKG